MDTRMSFEEFINYVMGHVAEYIPEPKKEGGIEMDMSARRKINENFRSLMIKKKGSNIGANINMDHLYGWYTDGACSLEEVLEGIAHAFCEAPETFDTRCLSDPGFVKPRLFIRVCNLECNREVLENIPYVAMEDLAITFHVLVEKRRDSSHSIVINNDLMHHLGFTKDELFEAAGKNSGDILPARVLLLNSEEGPSRVGLTGIMDIKTIFQYMGREVYGKELLQAAGRVMGTEPMPMYVVTNEAVSYGASAIFYTGVMEYLAKVLGGSYYILPSSIHETIVVPKWYMKKSELREMVKEINRSEVTPEEVLSDSVYFYDAKEKKFSASAR